MHRKGRFFLLVGFLFLLSVLITSTVFAAPTDLNQITLVSADSTGTAGNSTSSYASLSADGNRIAFSSLAANLIGAGNDTNNVADIFVRDIHAGTITRVSVGPAGIQSDRTSSEPVISANGQFVAFTSLATNLSPADNNSVSDIYVRDMQAGTTTLVSTDSNGVVGNNSSSSPSISADGRYVAFLSSATNLVGATLSPIQVDAYVHDRQTGSTTLVSVDSSGVRATLPSYSPAVSGDGLSVAFSSAAPNLIGPGADTNGSKDVFVHDLQTAVTTRVSVADSTGAQADGNSTFIAMTPDARYVVFLSGAPNLVSGDTNGRQDVFVHDRTTVATVLVSADSNGLAGNNDSGSFSPSISDDGRYVVFDSKATNLVTGDSNGFDDIFVHDLQTGTTRRLSLDRSGNQGNQASTHPFLSADGRYVAFQSLANNLDPADTNGFSDVFIVPLNPFFRAYLPVVIH